MLGMGVVIWMVSDIFATDEAVPQTPPPSFITDTEEEDSRKDYNYLCLKALRKDMLLVAYEIVKNEMGQLTDKSEELFTLPVKTSKKKEMKQLKLF